VAAVILVSPLPVYFTVEVEQVNVPVLTNGVPVPDKVIVLSLASNSPLLMVKTLETVIFPAASKVSEASR